MKNNIYIISLFLLFATSIQAKKVKFSVDMSGQIVNSLGIRVTGDFQTAAGFAGGDWSLATVMTKEILDTNIYSIILDIPAFKKYEFKFVNGDQFYETEFVPIESRVGYNFNDNRWIYIDSLSNDTTIIGAIRFSGNAPKNKKLVRLYVDMQNEAVSQNGVHVYGDFQGWNPTGTILYNFDSTTIYEVICYVDSLSTYEYKFLNGNTTNDSESVSGSCVINNNRAFTSVYDSMLAIICYSSCTSCQSTSNISENKSFSKTLFPNPTTDYSFLQISNDIKEGKVTIFDYSGRVIKEIKIESQNLILKRENLNPGVYIVEISEKSGRSKVMKWVIEQ